MTQSMASEILPRFDVESCHSTQVSAPARIVFDRARELDMSGSWLIRLLFRLRGLPKSALSAEGLSQIRFKTIREDPGRAFALGIIGRFWTFSGELVDFAPDLFQEFDATGYAKAVWTFEVEAVAENLARLSTTTRVFCLDSTSKRKFRAYWTIIEPFSGAIRKQVLKSVKHQAESCQSRVDVIPTRPTP